MSEADPKKMQITFVPVHEIESDPEFNCRGHISALDVVDLSRDIDENGLQQPIKIQPRVNGKYKFRVIMGHRRFMACSKILKWEQMPCIIDMDKLDDVQALVLNFTENIHRKDLNILQEAKVCKRFYDLGIRDRGRIGKLVGQSPGWVQMRLMLLDLPEEIQEGAAAGFFNQENIRHIHSLPPSQRMEGAKKIKEIKQRAESRKITKAMLHPYDPNYRHMRQRNEIFKLQEIIQNLIGNNFATRCLGWCAGYVSDGEIHQALAEVAALKGKTYIPPKAGDEQDYDTELRSLQESHPGSQRERQKATVNSAV